MSKRPFYITTTLPYVNAEPHIGFAMELVHADIISRWKKQNGYDVFFNSGTDEHGQKIYEQALKEGKDPQAYADTYALKFRELRSVLGLSDSLHFIRTTDPDHKRAAQEFWRRCDKVGDIYKKIYKIRYCVGCELEKTDSELVDGHCPIHPAKKLEIREEENYFFRFSKYEQRLLDLYDSQPDFVVPAYRLNEIRALIKRGLQDFSISRIASKMPWGVPVPDDSAHVMFVWFDALVSYISAIGWPDDQSTFAKYWPVTQCAGKDQVRQQAAMWQAMLMSAGLAPSRQIIIHGFINIAGQKMSKSTGNTVLPKDVVGEYGTDALRYFLAREINEFEDSDYTAERFHDAYVANLANGLGNLVSRVMKMASDGNITIDTEEIAKETTPLEYSAALNSFDIQQASTVIWNMIHSADETIQKTQPFIVMRRDPAKGKVLIRSLVEHLFRIALLLRPIMPETYLNIATYIKECIMPPRPLFPRHIDTQ